MLSTIPSTYQSGFKKIFCTDHWFYHDFTFAFSFTLPLPLSVIPSLALYDYTLKSVVTMAYTPLYKMAGKTRKFTYLFAPAVEVVTQMILMLSLPASRQARSTDHKLNQNLFFNFQFFLRTATKTRFFIILPCWRARSSKDE